MKFGGLSMAKDDYREKIVEDRQEIEIESEKSRMSRTSRKKKPRKSYGMKILLVIFIFIPLSFLIYFNWFYKPEVDETAQTKATNEVQVETSNTPKQSDDERATSSEKDDASNESEKTDEEAAAKKAEEEKKAEQERLAKEEQEAEEASKKAAEEAKKAEEEKRKQEEQEAANARKHVVQPNDTLYSIAMKYYKDPAAVDKIARANGIKNNNITVGSTLILP